MPVNTNGAIVVEQNNFIAVSGTGFLPNSTAVVWLFSEPSRLGTVSVGGDGTFTDRVPLAAGIEPGEHTAQVNGLTTDGAIRSLNLAVEVVLPVGPVVMDMADAAVIGDGFGAVSVGARRLSPVVLTSVIAGSALALFWLLIAFVRQRRELNRLRD